MRMKECLAHMEAQHPGWTQRIWEHYGRGFTRQHDATCAKRATDDAYSLAGLEVTITWQAWAEHRQRLGLVAARRTKKSHDEVSKPSIFEPESVQVQDAIWLPTEVMRLRMAIVELTKAIEARWPVVTPTTDNHRQATIEAFNMFDYPTKEVR